MLNPGFFTVGPTGGDTTYTKVPFTIGFNAPQFHRVVQESFPTPDAPPVTVQYDGVFTALGFFIDGTVSRDGKVDLTMTPDSVQPWSLDPLPTDRVYLSGLPFSVSDLKLPTASGRWVTDANAKPAVLPVPVQVVPESASLVVFGLITT